MLKIIESSNSLPQSFIVNKDAQFQPGQIAQLFLIKNNSVECSTSDGINPIGIIDDIKTLYFSKNVIKENHTLNKSDFQSIDNNNHYKTTNDIEIRLDNGNIIDDYFHCNIPGKLSAKRGIFTIAKNSMIQIDEFVTYFSYKCKISNIPGDDSTLGTNRVTVWNSSGLVFETDQFDPTQDYKNEILYADTNGLFTSKQTYKNQCQVAKFVKITANNTLVARWL